MFCAFTEHAALFASRLISCQPKIVRKCYKWLMIIIEQIEFFVSFFLISRNECDVPINLICPTYN